MRRFSVLALLVAAALLRPPCPAYAAAQESPGLEGRWTLNRELSQFPRELGFTPNWAVGGRPDTSGAAAGAMPARPESEDEARRRQQLTDEVRTPSEQLTIADTATAFTISDDGGRQRTFRLDGRDVTVHVDGVPVVVNARREGGRVVVAYKLTPARELRYTFSRVQSPPQLIVDVQFLERGKGDAVRRVYEPAQARETSTIAAPASPPTSAPPAVPARSPREPDRAAPAERAPVQAFDQRPDAALRGLTELGLVVEDLGSQAAACGLKQATIEQAVARQLSDAGFKVTRNGDEDTYVYVNVITTTTSAGLCVSRYDASVTSHAVATLSHQQAPVLVEVSLLHKGGLAGGAPAGHGQAVLQGIQQFVEGFVTRIRDAGKV